MAILQATQPTTVQESEKIHKTNFQRQYQYCEKCGHFTATYKLHQSIYVTGFGKTDHIVTIDVSRNTDLKY